MKRILFCAALALAACGHPFEATTPPSFVELPDNEYDNYDYRATTADGLVLAVRAIEHDPKGDMAFWVKAIKNRMRDRGGYALIEEKDVKSADGMPGHQLRFGHDEAKHPHLYYLTVFVSEDWLYILETGGTKELVTAQAADIDAAVASFKAK